MIMSNTFVDTLGMYVSIVGFTIAPLLKTRFTVCKPRATSGARGASSLVCWLSRADSPLTGSSTKASAWRSDVMREGSSSHLGVIVSADKASQLSVNDGAWDVAFPCWQVLGWRGCSGTWKSVSVVNGVWSFPSCLVLDRFLD